MNFFAAKENYVIKYILFLQDLASNMKVGHQNWSHTKILLHMKIFEKVDIIFLGDESRLAVKKILFQTQIIGHKNIIVSYLILKIGAENFTATKKSLHPKMSQKFYKCVNCGIGDIIIRTTSLYLIKNIHLVTRKIFCGFKIFFCVFAFL